MFDRPAVVAPTWASEWSATAASDGASLTQFAVDVFETALSEGVSYILVDAPRSMPESRATENVPYLCEVRPADLIWWDVVRVSGRPTFAEIRFREEMLDLQEGKAVQAIRRMLLGDDGIVYWQTWLPTKGKKDPWVLSDEGSIPRLNEIPLVPVLLGRRAEYCVATPPLEALADENVYWWQTASDQSSVLHAARVPVMFFKLCDAKEGDQLVIGVNRAVSAANPAADMRYVCHPGTGITEGREDVLDTAVRMAAIGIEQLLPRKSGGEEPTATAVAVDEAAELSPLQRQAGRMQDALQRAMLYVQALSGNTGTATVTINTTFGLALSNTLKLSTWAADRDRGDLSRLTYLQLLTSEGVYPPTFDVAGELQLVDREHSMDTVI